MGQSLHRLIICVIMKEFSNKSSISRLSDKRVSLTNLDAVGKNSCTIKK